MQTPASDCGAFVKSRRIIIAPSIICYRAEMEDELCGVVSRDELHSIFKKELISKPDKMGLFDDSKY